jgi:hypothetical protein
VCAGVDAGVSGICCGSGMVMPMACGGTSCVDLYSDPNNCGYCGKTCADAGVGACCSGGTCIGPQVSCTNEYYCVGTSVPNEKGCCMPPHNGPGLCEPAVCTNGACKCRCALDGVAPCGGYTPSLQCQ